MTRAVRRAAVVVSAAIAGAAMISGCTATDLPPPTAQPTTSAVGRTGAFTPLTAEVITPPSPIPGSDGKLHLAFELLVRNTAPRAATLTGVAISDAADPSRTVAELSGAELLASTVLSGDLALQRTTTIPAFATVLVTIDASVVPKTVPAALQPHLTADFAPAQPGQPAYVSIFPDHVVEDLPATTVDGAPVLSIGPPLAGGTWIMLNACCTLSAHRGAVLGRDGALVAPERYGIDFSRIGPDGFHAGATHSIESDYSYGAEVIAVADGTVVQVTDALPDQPLGVNPTGLSLDQLVGDSIVLDLGHGVYALYAHNVPGSPRVHVGQHVKKGQVLALLGNSGNSTAPHLHFQLMAGPQPLNSDGVPFTWDRYTLVGQFHGDSYEPLPPRSERNSYALSGNAIRFPGPATGNITTLPSDGLPNTVAGETYDGLGD